MKFSERTHPVLGFLQKDYTFKIGLPDDFDRERLDKMQETMQYTWPKLRHDFSRNICYLSNSFMDASDLATPKIRDNMEAFLLEDGVYAGTFMYKHIAICYHIVYTKNMRDGVLTPDLVLHMFVYRGDTLIACRAKKNGIKGVGNGFSFATGYNDTDYNKCSYGNEANDLIIHSWLWMVIVWITFKKYAEVELRELPAGKKVKDIATKYVNESKSNVTMLDSTWFTTLVKSDAFKVRGHFHFYWYTVKDGKKVEPYKRLVWVDTYEKEGMTIKAKKLINE